MGRIKLAAVATVLRFWQIMPASLRNWAFRNDPDIKELLKDLRS
jgi:hypothetical protein